jgi:hypothetical protein
MTRKGDDKMDNNFEIQKGQKEADKDGNHGLVQESDRIGVTIKNPEQIASIRTSLDQV